MGEIAEMMSTGILCCQCGVCLDEKVMDLELGIPIICDDCFKELSKEEQKNYTDRVESDYINKEKT